MLPLKTLRINITALEFYEQYWLPGKPLMLRGLARDWPIRTAWAKDQLLKTYGNIKVGTGPVPYSQVFGLRDKKGTLAQYMKTLDKTTKDQKGNP